MAERSEQLEDRLAILAKGIAHPVRVHIVRILAARPCVCGELVSELPVAQSTASQHLKVLKEAGWVQGEVEGARVCYCLVPAAFDELTRLLAELRPTAPTLKECHSCSVVDSITQGEPHADHSSI